MSKYLNTKGVTRIVIMLPDVVIKIPNPTYSWANFIRGILANINESRTYRYAQIPGSYAYDYLHLLCPVVWCSWGGWVLIMKRAEPITATVMGECGNKPGIAEHKRVFPGDDTQSNYGILNNRVVKIDYGELDRAVSEYAPYSE